MTFSSRSGLLALLLASPLAWAGLGEAEGSIAPQAVHMQARQSVARAALYTVHELKMADGSRVRQYVASSGRVFAVSWNTLYKPELSALLGPSFSSYSHAARTAAQQGGVQRQFRHEGDDLVVQSSGHLHVYAGYAYRRSLLPPGLRLDALGLG